MDTPNSDEEGKKRQWMVGLFNAVEKESERGKILLLAAHIDEVLGKMLKTFLKSPRKAKDDKLFSRMGILSTFAGRIEMAYRLGLISKDAADCYDILRNIRNDCAHKMQPYSFDDSGKQAFIHFKSLSYRMSGISNILECVERIGDKTSENVFIMLLMIHAAFLEAHLIRIKESPDNFLAIPSLEAQKRYFAGCFDPLPKQA